MTGTERVYAILQFIKKIISNASTINDYAKLW